MEFCITSVGPATHMPYIAKLGSLAFLVGSNIHVCIFSTLIKKTFTKNKWRIKYFNLNVDLSLLLLFLS